MQLYIIAFSKCDITFSACSDVFFSNNVKKTYGESVKCCESINSKLMSYGTECVKAAKAVGMQGYAWVAKPWIKHKGLFVI